MQQRDKEMKSRKKTLSDVEDRNAPQSLNGHFKEKATLKEWERRDNKFNKHYKKRCLKINP